MSTETMETEKTVRLFHNQNGNAISFKEITSDGGEYKGVEINAEGFEIWSLDDIYQLVNLVTNLDSEFHIGVLRK